MRKMLLSLALAVTIAACVGVSSADAQRWWRRGYYYGYPTYSYPTYVYPNYSYPNYSYYYAPDYGTYYQQPGYYYSAPGYYSGPTYYYTYPNYWRGYRWWR